MVAMQHALESKFGNVGGDLLCDITFRTAAAAEYTSNDAA